MEGEQGWVMQCVFLGASFRRLPVSGQALRCGLSTYQQRLRPQEMHRQEARPHSSCHPDFSGG